MTPRFPAAALALAVTTLLFPVASQAGCSTAGTGALCLQVIDDVPARDGEAMSSSASATSPEVAIGDLLPRGEYSLIINADYYGLPAVSDGWVYMRVGTDAYRVDWQTHQVLERVTEQAAANF